MTIRTTPLALYTRTLSDLQRSYGRLAQAQIDVASGKRLHFVSDDPADAARLLSTKGALARTLQARESLSSASFATQKQSEVLESLSTVLSTARVKAEGAANGINSKFELETFAAELDGLLGELVAKANTKLEGRYLFSGSKVGTPPILTGGAGGSIQSVQYGGDDLTRMVRIGPHETKPIDVSGKDVFFTSDRAPSVFAGPSGLKGTTGASDTMVGTAELVIEHLATTLGDGALGSGGDTVSGLQPGLSSADDTIVGNHTLTVGVDEASGQPALWLDGGDPVPFDGTETDLELEAPDGSVIHVDVTALTAGFTGDVPIVADGTIAVAGGPPQPLSFQDDFVLDGGDGRVVHLDTTEVRRTGENLAVFPGTESVFDAIIGLRDDILGQGGFPDEGLASRIQARLASLDRGRDTLLGALAEVGSRSATFERLEESLSLFELSLEERAGELEGTDLFEGSAEIAEAEAAYQAALAVTGKLGKLPSLLNYL